MRKYFIYQLDKRVDYRFQGWSYGKKLFNLEDYDLVSDGVIESNEPIKVELEKLFEKYNMNIPFGYQGRSMSVSDVIKIEEGVKSYYYYVDSIGFEDITEIV